MTDTCRFCFFVILVSCCQLGTSELSAFQQPQPARTLPNDDYYRVFNDYYRGEFSRSARDFRSSARGGFIGVNGRWIDAVCYHTMTGECLYSTGDIALALEQYGAALQVFLANDGWLAKTDFPDNVPVSSSALQRARITWGRSSRDIAIGNFNDSIPVMIGNLSGIERGNVVQQPQLRPANVGEVMRCLSIALRRRLELLGPAAPYDDATRQVIGALERSGVPSNHWARAWVDIPLGIAKAADGDVDRGAGLIAARLQTAGGFDHPLTAVGMLELGKLYFRAERYDEAGRLFFEATFPAAVFGQQDVLEEAFYWGTKTHLVKKTGGEYPPLVAALDWAGREGSRQLVVSLATQLAECRLHMGDAAAAGRYLAGATTAMRRNEIGVSPIGARYKYQAAHVSFQTGNLEAGVNDLADALKLQTAHSRWRYHIGLIDQMFVGNGITERNAMEMFDELLRDPSGQDWLLDPLECYSVLLMPPMEAMEHWFSIAYQRRDHEKAIEIADRIRRRRFYQSLPLGGRVMSLRWVLEAPQGMISEAGKQHRQDLFQRFPGYASLSTDAAAAVNRLAALPVQPERSAPEAAQQRTLLDQLAQLSGAQEAAIADIALRREPSENEFPPLHATAELQQQLKPGQTLLSYFSTSNNLFVFRLTQDAYEMSSITRPATIRQGTTKLLRAIGNLDRNQTVDDEILQDESWIEASRELAAVVFPDMEAGDWDQCEELIIVPDGMLWYLPFEALHVGDEEESQALIEKVNIRYLPTTSLVFNDARRNPGKDEMTVMTGKLFPRDDQEVAVEAFERLQSEMPEATRIHTTFPGASSLLNVAIHRLLVLDDVEPARTPYAFPPLQLDEGRPGSDLNSWMSLPFGGCEQIILPGFHTPAEVSLRQRNADGSEVFLTVCGLMSSGSRTIMLSRWRPGGQSSFDMMREFVKELPERSAMDAWRRSLDLSWRGEVSPDLEPRLEPESDGAALNLKHPFFWAPYMLVDTGVEPEADE